MQESSIMKEFSEKFNIIAGPCAVENYEMLDCIAKNLSFLGVKFLRAGLINHELHLMIFRV